MIIKITIALAVLTIAVAMAITSALVARTTPLGVSIPRSRADDAVVASAVSRYRRLVLASGAVAALAVLALPIAPEWASVVPLVVLGLGLAAYLAQRRRIIEAKSAGGWFEDAEYSVSAQIAPGASAGENSDVARAIAVVEAPRVPVFWYLASLSLLGSAAALVAARWSEIPNVIVTHWGPGLEPDAWADKSAAQIFIPTWIGLGTLALLWGSTLAVAKTMVAVRGDRSIKGQLRSRAVLAGMNKGFGALALMMAIGFATMQVINYLPGYERFMGATFGIFIALTVLGSVAILVPIATAQSKTDDALRGFKLPDDVNDSPDNDKFYKLGTFYYNPDDPAVLVEKRFGVGMDFNYATWQAKVFMVTILVVLIVCIALPFLG